MARRYAAQRAPAAVPNGRASDTQSASAPADGLGYGTAADLGRLLDGVSVLLREERQAHWNENADLREASKAVADHLYFRLGIHPEPDSHDHWCPRRDVG